MKIRLEKRDGLPAFQRVLNPVIFIILALAFCSIFMLILKLNPFTVYAKMFKGAFGSPKAISESIVYAIPLMLCGLGVSVAFKMSLNNIGAEGQYAMGAMAAAGVALFCNNLPSLPLILLMTVASFAAGALWSVISAAPKAFWGVNETIVTLMMNYVALKFVDFVCYGPWRDTSGINLPYTPTLSDKAKLSQWFGTRINSALFIAIIVAILIFLFFKYTTVGYQISVISKSIVAAQYAGISIRKNILIVMLISGGLAGLAGVAQVGGMVYRLQPDISGGAGFTAIVISYLSKFNPLIVLIVSVLFGGLTMGGYAVQVYGVPVQTVTMIQGSILLFVLAGEIFTRYKFVRVKNTVKDGEAA